MSCQRKYVRTAAGNKGNVAFPARLLLFIDGAVAFVRRFEAIRDEESPIIALTKQYLQKNYIAQDGKSRLDLMKCMDMYHSEDLDKLAKDYVQHPNDNWVKDNLDRVNENHPRK